MNFGREASGRSLYVHLSSSSKLILCCLFPVFVTLEEVYIIEKQVFYSKSLVFEGTKFPSLQKLLDREGFSNKFASCLSVSVYAISPILNHIGKSWERWKVELHRLIVIFRFLFFCSFSTSEEVRR